MGLTTAQMTAAFAGLTPSMEDNDLNVNINASHDGDNVDEDQVPLDTSAVPETAELDLAEDAEQIEETNEEIADLEETDAALESLTDTLTAWKDSGEPFSNGMHQMFDVALANALAPYPGLTPASIGMPSCEDFANDPEDGYTVSMEKIGDAARAIGSAIKKALQQFVAYIKQFVKNLFSAREAAKSKTQKLEKVADAVKGTPKGDIKVPGILGKSFGSAEIENLNRAVKEVLSMRSADMEVVIKSILASEEPSIDEVDAKLNKLMGGVKGYAGKTLLGGIQLTLNESGQLAIKTAEAGEGVTMKAGSIGWCKAILTSNLTLLATVEEYQKKAKDIEKVADKMIVAAGDLEKEEEKARGGNRYAAWKAKRAAMSKVATWYRQRGTVESTLVKKSISLVNAGNNVVAQTLASANKKED